VSVQIGTGSAADGAPALGDGARALRADQVLAAHPDAPFLESFSQMVCVGTRETFLEIGAPHP
jgi:X-X-X-Leu-X-X-Gly heptad repeat protein